MVVYKEFPTDITSKSNPVDADILLIADSEDNNEMKKITIGSITTDIGDGLIVDGSESSTTTYSSVKINDLNEAQDVTIASLGTTKLNRAAQLRTGNGAWKTTYNDASGNETELALGAATRVLTSGGASTAPTWEVPTADVVGLTEDTAGDMAADFLLAYDSSATANRKQKPQVYTASDAEATAGTVTNKWMTPKNVKDNYTLQTYTTAGLLTLSVGANASPTYSSAVELTKNGFTTFSITIVAGSSGNPQPAGISFSDDGSSYTDVTLLAPTTGTTTTYWTIPVRKYYKFWGDTVGNASESISITEILRTI